MAQRLMATFQANPWTLVTLLSGVATLVSILESLVTILGGKGLALSFAGLAGFAVWQYTSGGRGMAPEQRRKLAMMAAVVLCSGYFVV